VQTQHGKRKHREVGRLKGNQFLAPRRKQTLEGICLDVKLEDEGDGKEPRYLNKVVSIKESI